jgi:hypothetical protein
MHSRRDGFIVGRKPKHAIDSCSGLQLSPSRRRNSIRRLREQLKQFDVLLRQDQWIRKWRNRGKFAVKRCPMELDDCPTQQYKQSESGHTE